MGVLDNIVSVSITAATTGVTQQGFGTPLVAAYTTVFPERVREYSSLAGMITDGFTATSPAYIAASAIVSQNPRVKTFKIGRRGLVYTQTVTLTPVAVNSTIYKIKIGTETATFTSDSSATVAEICAGVTSAINALSGAFTATNNTTNVGITADNAGVLFSYSDYDPLLLKLKVTTTDPGIATDLAAINAYDPNWYGLAIDSESEPEINAAAAWVEANKKVFFCTANDEEVTDVAVTTDVMSDLKAANYNRTMCVYHPNVLAYAGAAWMGTGLPYPPGSITYCYKTLSGIPVVSLSQSKQSATTGKKGNYYIQLAGVGITYEGTASSGQYMDITNGIDWLTARIQERIFSLFVNSKKVPYTDQGVALVVAQVMAQLTEGVNAQFLAADPAPTVTAPLVKDISPVDKANRLLPNVYFTATVAGAIHKVQIMGTISI